jgi:hypothetical protein
MYLTAETPMGIIGRLLPSRMGLRAVERQAVAYAERLLIANSSRVVSDLKDRLTASCDALASDRRAMLSKLRASAARADEQARELKRQGDEAIVGELARLESCRTEIEMVRSAASTRR